MDYLNRRINGKLDVFVNAPSPPDSKKNAFYDTVRLRLEIYLNRLEQRHNTLKFEDVRLVNLSSKRVHSPDKIIQQIEKSDADLKLVFLLGELHRDDDRIFLIQHRSRGTDLSSMLNISKLLVDENVFVFLDNYGDDETDTYGSSVSSMPDRLKIAHNIETNRTFFDEFVTLNRIVPSFTANQVLAFLSRDSEWTEKKLAQNIASLGFRSITPMSTIWAQDAHNFGSKNKGSREDGVQTLKFLSKDLKYAEDCRYLLEFFSVSDPEPDVRLAANLALSERAKISIKAPVIGKYITLDVQPLLGQFAAISGGTFFMGSEPDTDKHSLPEERPLHEVHVQQFSIQKRPVSVELYRVFAREIGKQEVVEKREGLEKNFPITRLSRPWCVLRI